MLSETNSSSIARQWGPQRTVELNRDPVKGLGISIISGKLDIMQGGIFIKNVLPDSPAGWNGTLKRGDRILEVSGVDIRNAGHAKAVDVIKNAPNPVKFIIQSLVPLPKKPEREGLPVASVPSMLPPPLEVTAPDDLPKLVDAKLPPYKMPKVSYVTIKRACADVFRTDPGVARQRQMVALETPLTFEHAQPVETYADLHVDVNSNKSI
ncbi:InaD-like protein [Araneus ventricosus]|uniref:InaD-like protein n=1 Tax=Araneus ventricosus TaxID=182803 RepID=A0A4Y2UWF2_ARAVE|nr:InaD-like protein [Araneus ventricosus]